MAKAKTKYVCQNCGAEHPKWQGQCLQCKEWNTLVEEVVEPKQTSARRGVPQPLNEGQVKQILLTRPEIKAASSSKSRFSSNIGELDRVLGGGIVPGAVMLVGGEPGIGKSTLLTQMCLLVGLVGEVKEGAGAVADIDADTHSDGGNSTEANANGVGANVDAEKAKTKTPVNNNSPTKQAQPESKISKGQLKTDKTAGRSKQKTKNGFSPILYVCGEESPEQINLRINRIIKNEQFLKNRGFGQDSVLISDFIDQNLQFVTSTDVDQITALIHQVRPLLVVIDSIQTLSTSDLTGASGSVGQVRESTERLIKTAKPLSVPLFLVGHVTKEGTIAGPKTLEHMVDAVLQLEGERTGQYRILRALKNRFGATDEVGVFKVVEYGYEEVVNPSELFLENQQAGVPGCAVTCVMEGTRPLLLEVQALVNQSQLAMPRRVGRGIELSRIQVLAAVLQKHTNLPLANFDIFLSVAGGFKVKEPAVDLSLAAAIAGSLNNKIIKKKTVLIGEVGLLGEVRPVPYLERRIKEAKRLGFTRIISAKTHQQLKNVLKDLSLL